MSNRYLHIEELQTARAVMEDPIAKRLQEFSSVLPSDYFYELVYCLLTPQSSARHALEAQRLLTTLDFRNCVVDPLPVLRRKESYIRFHVTKAKHLLVMKKEYPLIESLLIGKAPATEKRIWLAENVLGLSYKEATHFLRNIGKNESLAILDRHILKHLLRHRVISEIPKTLTPKRYLEIELAFQQFADLVGIPINALDLLFWSSETGIILK